MSEKFFFLVNVFFALAVAILVLAMIRKRRDALKGRRNILWVQDQLERALRQIVSSEEDEILAGCQTLAILNDRRVRLKALGRIVELTKHPNPNIAKQANATYEKIVGSFGGI